jgi:hypothetical protein
MLEGANMRNYGNKTGIVAIYLFVMLFFCPPARPSNYYYLVAYEKDSLHTGVLFEKIDISTHNIIFSTPIELRGEVQFSTPIPLQSRITQLYFIATINGLSGKNTDVLNQITTYYAMCDSSGNIYHIGRFPNIQLLEYKKNVSGTIEINYIDSSGESVWGNLNVDNGGVAHINYLRREIIDTINYPNIGIFGYPRKISETNNAIYWHDSHLGRYVLKINPTSRLLVDSLNVDHANRLNHLIGLGELDTIVYSFNLSYNIMGGPVSLRKTSIDSSYVKTYRTSNFTLLDSIPINNPDTNLGYIGTANGPCEKVGPYFVYYFFGSGDYRYFSPAMLFIFDTRTNEARWLRVGWR